MVTKAQNSVESEIRARVPLLLATISRKIVKTRFYSSHLSATVDIRERSLMIVINGRSGVFPGRAMGEEYNV